MRFIIIDNHPQYVVSTRSLLVRLGYDSSGVWPAEGQVFHSWRAVFDTLVQLGVQTWNPREDCIVLLLDLALDTNDEAYSEGIAQIRGARPILEPYVTIALTQYGTAAEDSLRGVVDAVIDRTRIQGQWERGTAAVRLGIAEALRRWGRRTGRSAPTPPELTVHLADSPPMRRAEAAVGADVIGELAAQIADPSATVHVSVATGGYSGAFVVRLDWVDGGGRKSVICKVSRDRDVLEDELIRWRKAASADETFAGLIPPFVETNIQQLGVKGNAWYVIQSRAPGRTLEQAILEDRPLAELDTEFTPLMTRLERMTEASVRGGAKLSPPPDGFQLSDADISRCESSARVLSDLRSVCIEMGYLEPDDSHSPEKITRFVDEVVKKWPDVLVANGFGQLAVHEQHGDLNPRNIILPDSGTPQLIDFARFDLWPFGYDLVRLELQLFLRVIDTHLMRDAFPSCLRNWQAVWREAEAYRTRDRRGDLELPATTGVDSFLWFSRKLQTIRERVQTQVSHAGPLPLGRLIYAERTFEAIRMCSYQDASWFKRLWFLFVGMESARRAEIF